ncbi:MAG: septum formation protein Maf [Lachnospiraceae bacterium]|nr:septum formation protein Maf [Lachnospiraceae bacterium]
MQNLYPVFLASASPRRRELLAHAGYTFEIIVSDSEEKSDYTIPHEFVTDLALQKALAVYNRMEKEQSFFVIGADTVVACDNEILGKPSDEADARRMLNLLSGRTHQVYTGVGICFYDHKKQKLKKHSFYEKTDVTFYEMSPEEIEAYIATKDPFDKAGAYGIQSGASIYIRKIHGDYNNVVGLPIARLYHELNLLF